jgi:beta-xylosidase
MGSFTYTNPHQGICPGPIRDPYVVNHEGMYYLTGTMFPFLESPGVPLWSSRDLVTWESHGLLIDRSKLSEDVWYRDRFWAPEIHVADSGFYRTFNSRNFSTRHKHGIAIARSGSIAGPYSVMNMDNPLPWWPARHYQEGAHPDDQYLGNDATLFTDDDGTTYLFWNQITGIWQQRIDLLTGSAYGERIHAIVPIPNTWQSKIEGPCVRKRGGWYYCFYSGYGCNYDIGVVRSTSVTGPWHRMSMDPLISPRHTYTHTGHNGVFVGPDQQWWICYHAQQGAVGTERLCIDRLDFSDAGMICTKAPTIGTHTYPS